MALFATGKMDQMLVKLYISSLFKNIKMSSPKTVLSTNLLSQVVQVTNNFITLLIKISNISA